MDKENAGNGSENRAHHPWDEVSLPGAGTNPSEQPTILEVLNKVNTTPVDSLTTPHIKVSANPKLSEGDAAKLTDVSKDCVTEVDDNAQKSAELHETEAEVQLQSNIAESDNLVSSHSSSSLSADSIISTDTNTVERVKSTDRQSSEEHVLDIESHLIETYDDYQAKDDSVGINELPPIQDELTQGSSKIETEESNVRTVIEVEPAGAKTKKPIETLIQPVHSHTTADVIESTTDALHEPEISENIRQTAEKLVNDIEKEVLKTLSEQIAQAQLEKEQNQAIDEANTTHENTETESTSVSLLEEINTTLSQKVDEQLSEVTSILKASKHGAVSLHLSGPNGETLNVNVGKPSNELKVVDVPSPNTPLEAEERKLFIESLPQIESDETKLAADCKREYYQSLKKYLVQNISDKPPVPLQTYRWEDLKRAKERGGYPWTHLYKRPLGPDEEPEIVLLLRKSQELRFTSESPKSLKKVRIDELVLVKEAERYIQELSEDEDEEEHNQSATDEEENHSLHSESISCVSDSVLAAGKPRKVNRFSKIRGILKHRKSGRSTEDAQSLPGTSTNTSRHHSEENLSQINPQPIIGNGVQSPEHKKSCYPIMKKLKSMADRQKKRLNIKRITLKKDEKIVLGEETKIMKLKNSPKSERGEIPHFIEKQDSDDVVEIVELDESPSRKYKDEGWNVPDDVIMEEAATKTSIVEPDEIIEIAQESKSVAENDTEELTSEREATTPEAPKKAPRLRREHVYEEIEQGDPLGVELNDIRDIASVEALKRSLAKQDNSTLMDIEAANKPIPLDRMGSSEEEPITDGKPTMSLLAPISSIDSTSSDEDRNRPQLSPVAEESDAGSVDGHLTDRETVQVLRIIEEHEQAELKPSIKKESSPAPSDKKVTFSHVEDEAEPHREDIELPEDVLEAATAATHKWKNMSDHEYEPIGAPSTEEAPSFISKESSPVPNRPPFNESKLSMEIETVRDEMKEAEELQKDLEDRYFSSEPTTPRTESRMSYEVHTSQVDSSALEELPLKPENRKKGFMASAQDRTRKMQAGFKNQAGKIKTKLRSPAKKPPSGSPKAKDRKRFKAPEFPKIKMPEIKRPDMSKLKELKRPEFTKFNKPDLSKFKLPEKFSTLKLRRSKSFKENETEHDDDMSGVTPESGVATEAAAQPQKKIIDFNFGTFPRAFRKKKKPLEPQPSFVTDTATEDPSIIPSTETQPSLESSSSPQGDRGPGPVRSRWADKFSDVSYNDSEGSRYRRYGSEQESFDRESSLERRMKEDLEETGSEAATDLGILGGVADNKQFAEFDEENRAIHEISNLRAGEFKRRPMVHQDSDLRSEDSKEAVGWTDKEVQKNKLLRKAELEAEASYLKYPSEEGVRQETQSTASSGKKVVMEEIDDDEFFLRKRGVSEDNIELRQYISNAIREGYDMPINALQHVGQTSEPMEYGDYDVPPPKPRRLHRSYQPEDVSQDFESQRSEYGDDLSMSQNGSDFFGAPKRPMRKGRSKYSMDSQDVPMSDEHERISHEQYFDDDEEYLRPPPRGAFKDDEVSDVGMNNLDFSGKKVFPAELDQVDDVPRPNPPRRRKRQIRESSLDKDSYINGFSGRSVSNSYLQPPEDVIVYRTEHEYPIPLATPENYTDGASEASRKSRSASRYEEDDRTSRGAESLALDAHLRSGYGTDHADVQEKFVIDMMENDGYAVVRKEHIPKPTPPARRKKFTRSPGERFATMPNMRTKRSTPPPERPPPPRGYTPTTDQPEPPRRKSALSLDAPQNYEEEDDYEEPANLDHERPESPRNLQSGEIINRMKYRPLPPPPRPPREKRQRSENKGSMQDVHSEYHDENNFDDRDGGGERIATSSTADSYDQNGDFEDDPHFAEVEVSTQTDPLPDDFVCEEFEITEDMKVIEPRRPAKTLDELLREEQEAEVERSRQLTEDEQLARGLQRFRDANQRSLSERSRASSQASKSLSRPQTPSAVVIERRISTPVPNQQSETMLEAALIVHPIDDLDLEEEELRREGLLTDSSQHSTSDIEKDDESKLVLSDYSHGPSSIELDKAVEGLLSQSESERETERDDEEVERTMRDYEFDDERAERFSSHYDEDEEEQSGKEQATVESPLLEASQEALSGQQEDKSKDLDITDPDHELDFKEEIREDPVKYDYERKTSGDRELVAEHIEKTEEELIFEEPPLPPPRRKSTTVIETAEPPLTVVEHIPLAKEVAPMHSVVGSSESEPPQLPIRLGDLEVERLRVHALQAGQIMVSQLHGQQITSDKLECKSGNLVVQNIELPPGFIEDIVERVRNTDRAQLLTSETQTSRQASSDMLSHEHTPSPVRELVPPPKPPRHRDLESIPSRPAAQFIAAEYTTEPHTSQRLRNFDEETQTDPAEAPASLVAPPPAPPLVLATTEYLQSLGPLAFYNIRRGEEEERKLDNESTHSCRRHHHHHHCRHESSSSEMDDTNEVEPDEPPQTRRHRTRSRSSPPEPQSVTQAGRKFISACSLSLVNIINRLTAYMRGGANKDQDGDALGLRQIPTLVVLFIAITFGLLLFLLSGRSVHTHHWDYFNPPGNEGRPS